MQTKPIAICAHCHQEFIQNRKDKKYCDSSCRGAASRVRNLSNQDKPSQLGTDQFPNKISNDMDLSNVETKGITGGKILGAAMGSTVVEGTKEILKHNGLFKTAEMIMINELDEKISALSDEIRQMVQEQKKLLEQVKSKNTYDPKDFLG